MDKQPHSSVCNHFCTPVFLSQHEQCLNGNSNSSTLSTDFIEHVQNYLVPIKYCLINGDDKYRTEGGNIRHTYNLLQLLQCLTNL